MPKKNESVLLQQSLATVRSCSVDQSAFQTDGITELGEENQYELKNGLLTKAPHIRSDLIGRYGVGFQFMNFNEGKRISTKASFYFDAFSHQSHMNGDVKCLERISRTFHYPSKTKQRL